MGQNIRSRTKSNFKQIVLIAQRKHMCLALVTIKEYKRSLKDIRDISSQYVNKDSPSDQGPENKEVVLVFQHG